MNRFAVVGLSLLLCSPAGAAVFTVTKTADTNDGACGADCSLREAVQAANAAPGVDSVVIGPGVHKLTRSGRIDNLGVTGDLDVLGDLVITGAGADLTVLDGGGRDRILDVASGASLELSGVTVRGGVVPLWSPSTNGENGGGIRAAGRLLLVDCLISGNSAEMGGGVSSATFLEARGTTFADNEAFTGGGLHAAFSLRLDNVTLSGNRAYIGGGAILDPRDALFAIRHATVSGNEANLGGGLATEGIDCPSGPPCEPLPVQLDLSVVAGNSVIQEAADCLGLVHTGQGNVFGDPDSCFAGPGDIAGTAGAPLDPKLAPLGNYGGSTPTRLPLEGSPAIDRVPASACAGGGGKDQRGRLRPVGGCDAGSVEANSECQPGDAGDTALCLGAGGRFRVTARWATQTATEDAHPFPLTRDTGSFWFFNADNLELMIKVLDGCAINHRFWVFQAGLTDVGVEVFVNDTLTGRSWSSSNPPGVPFPTRLDTSALDVCEESR